jgi:hypothetical protein
MKKTLTHYFLVTYSSQDSLHKNTPQKKKGIKSSLGRFFSKKEKVKSKDSSMLGSVDGVAMSGVYSDSDMMTSGEGLGLAGGLGQKGDFDRRKKKK